jgi:alpha-D-ribose 1-methylphosphonate 5-triphosphate synthase subunit PhnG
MTPLPDRATWLGILATAGHDQLLTLWDVVRPVPDHHILRAPEIGTVMLRGRTGGTGLAFNLGEMTVTRASVQLTSGPVGHGHVQGRSHAAALAAALIDALMQTAQASELETKILSPLAAEQAGRQAARAARAAATKVDFFTLVRGDD